jgi:hypothetical protein
VAGQACPAVGNGADTRGLAMRSARPQSALLGLLRPRAASSLSWLALALLLHTAAAQYDGLFLRELRLYNGDNYACGAGAHVGGLSAWRGSLCSCTPPAGRILAASYLSGRIHRAAAGLIESCRGMPGRSLRGTLPAGLVQRH